MQQLGQDDKAEHIKNTLSKHRGCHVRGWLTAKDHIAADWEETVWCVLVRGSLTQPNDWDRCDDNQWSRGQRIKLRDSTGYLRGACPLQHEKEPYRSTAKAAYLLYYLLGVDL